MPKKKKPTKPKPRISPKDTVHVRTTRGHKIVVKRGSPYHKQAKKERSCY